MRIGRAWKDFELEVSKAYGGMRRVRINYGERGSDIIHDKYSIEVKYGWQVPLKALGGLRCRFLDKAFAQAQGFQDPRLG